MFRLKSLKRDSKSITGKLLLPMAIVLILQAGIFVSTIFFGGTIAYLENYSGDIFSERVASRRTYIENEMIHRWSNIDSTRIIINDKVANFLRERNVDTEYLLSHPEFATEVLNIISGDVIGMMRMSSVTGGFVILDDNGLSGMNSRQKTGIYLRDLDPLSNPPDTSDMLIERAPSSLVKNLQISMDIHWRNQFFFPNETDREYQFFYRPLEVARQSGTYAVEDMGYWSPVFPLSPHDLPIITYSLPLIDEDGYAYGVMGVGLTIDFIQSLLPYYEINSTQKGAYLLAVDTDDDNGFLNVAATGPIFKKINGDNTCTYFGTKAVRGNIFPMSDNGRLGSTVYGCVEYLQLYNQNTPFHGDQWALIGILDKNSLLSASASVKQSVMLSLSISLFIGLIGIAVAGIIFTHPIIDLAGKVRKLNPDASVELPVSNIEEIDELANAIEILSARVADSSSRMSQIIAMVNMPIAAFMYQKGAEQVYCSDRFFDVLGITDKPKNTHYVNKLIFDNYMRVATARKGAEDDIYQVLLEDGATRWLSVRIQSEESRTLGVITDVTKETIEKQKLERERDYDPLTKLLNRRAFKSIVTSKLSSGTIHIAAFVMWDLDNLKFINDTYGHDMGDTYISMMAEVLRELIPGHAVVARMSGDEFFAFIYGYNTKNEIRSLIKQVQTRMYGTLLTLPDGKTVKIRASGGVSWYPENSADYDELIKFADFAMYEIKNSFKGTFCEFDMDSYKRDSFLLTCKGELDKLIEEGLVRYAFQPIIDARTGKTFAYEALMRSQSEKLRAPLDIIRLARSQAKLYQIEKLTWFKALESYSTHIEQFGDALLFINSIPSHILNEGDMQELERRYKPWLSRIVVELLEGDQANDNFTQKKQRMVTRWGGMIAIDDFGAGYNNELILLSVRPDFVKIDMSIIRGIDTDTNRQKMVNNFIAYARSQNIKILAEGVETPDELKMLISFGIDYIQGFYTGQPSILPAQADPNITREILELNQTCGISGSIVP